MFQRLDKLRKNAFASVILFGTNNDSSISGVWLFRGQELAFQVGDISCHLMSPHVTSCHLMSPLCVLMVAFQAGDTSRVTSMSPHVAIPMTPLVDVGQ